MCSRELSTDRSFAEQNPISAYPSETEEHLSFYDARPLVPEFPQGFVEICLDSAGGVAVIQRWQKQHSPAVT